MPQIYRANYRIPDDRTPREYEQRIKNTARRDLIADMLVKMDEHGENVSDYLIRFTEYRREDVGYRGYLGDAGFVDYNGEYETIIELNAVPLEQARALLGR